MAVRILFLENTPEVARAVAAMLEKHHFDVMRADDDRLAAQRLGAEHFDVLMVEVKPHRDDPGLRFLHHIKAYVPHMTTRIVVISSDLSPAMQHELDAIGICDLVPKPVHETEILEAIRECLDRTPATVQ